MKMMIMVDHNYNSGAKEEDTNASQVFVAISLAYLESPRLLTDSVSKSVVYNS